jgi:HEAT repeat protein
MVWLAVMPGRAFAVINDDKSPPSASTERIATLLKNLRDRDRAVQVHAARSLADIGPKASKAVPDLVNVLLREEDGEPQKAAVFALLQMGPNAGSADGLIGGLGSKNPKIRARAAWVLGQLNCNVQASKAISFLVKAAVQDPDASVRLEAIEAITYTRDPKAVPPLVGLLRTESDQKVRDKIFWSFVNMGPRATAAIPALTEILLSSTSISDREWAAYALTSMDRAAIPGLVRFLQEPNQDKELQKLVIIGIGRMARGQSGAEIRDAIPTLIDGLNDDYLRTVSIDALREAGPHACAAIPRLSGLVKKVRAAERVVIGRCLFRIDPDNQLVLALMLDGLRDKDEHVRELAAGELGELGTKAQKAIPALVETLKNNDRGVRMASAYALGDISPRFAKEVIKALQEAEKDTDEMVRRAAVMALENIQSKE